MFKRMQPKEFKVGRKYRVNLRELSMYTYTCESSSYIKAILEREGGRYTFSLPDETMWEKIPSKKKKVFK
jgi:hypothetical protein